ncbi:hypothetical protein [Halochromatium salexigens]|uniref:hypothetical protein n=1 Tax=Halochromatium salexigens TaxID=49447 RepID=UPI001F5DE229|nr:hypothetical protein [Halochromatium salexigens]
MTSFLGTPFPQTRPTSSQRIVHPGVVLLHSWLERRVERCAHRMEDAVTRIFTRPLHAPARAGDSAHGRP